MKKSHHFRLKLAILALALAAIGPGAKAQSSVTLYGTADIGVQYSRLGEGSLTQIQSGIAEGSRFGLKGEEDLGNGYRAIFRLESRIELDTGQLGNRVPYSTPPTQTRGSSTYNIWTAGLPAALVPTVNGGLSPQVGINTSNTFFDRQAYAGLVTPVGAVMLGRQYTPAYEVLNYFDPMEAGSAGTAGTLLVPGGVDIRWSNALQYRLAANGVSAALFYSPGENAGGSSLSRRWGANVRYVQGNINVGMGYNAANAVNGNSGLRTFAVGGSYAFNQLKVFLGYSQSKNENSDIAIGLFNGISATSAATANAVLPTLLRNFSVDEQLYLIGAHYQLGNGRLMVSYGMLKDKKSSIGNLLDPIPFDGSASILGLGYDYNLSKRTDIYTFYGLIRNNRDAAFAPGGAGYLGGFSNKPGADTSAFQLGIRHKF